MKKHNMESIGNISHVGIVALISFSCLKEFLEDRQKGQRGSNSVCQEAGVCHQIDQDIAHGDGGEEVLFHLFSGVAALDIQVVDQVPVELLFCNPKLKKSFETLILDHTVPGMLTEDTEGKGGD